ncbi:dual oxidase maturation factor 2 [Oxyura jamaicensis]|uniref:dual oxidase maturation factor 2 n=1 Tax=Oxyura jamaicensis TaxID=8884 RepID=UPI0015A58C13|nr:dual oxidase maturation factor 2 [Oxyura jamaicensis]
MTLFDGVYPFYLQQRKHFVFDVSTIIVIIVFLTFASSFLLIIPGIRGRARLYWMLRVLLSLVVGVVIVAVQFTGDWESGWVTANTSYKSFSSAMVKADIGLHVGLAGVNITLLGNPVNQINETINYNEHFAWSFDADYDHSYSEGLEKGLPSPILYVAEKFTTESPCNMHRQYRISGHYTSATLWVAFCTWLISNMLFSMPVLVYGGYMVLITGAFMIFSLLSFSTVRNSLMCPIQFGTASLLTVYGGSFWLTLVIGLLCFVAGITIVALHYFNSDLLKTFFDLHEVRAEDCQEMTEVYINPQFISNAQSPPQPSRISLSGM